MGQKVFSNVGRFSNGGSVIIHHFAIKSPFFKLLGARSLNKSIFALVVGLCACVSFSSCGGGKKTGPPSGLKNRVLASQGVSSTFTIGSLQIVNGQNDTLPRVSPIPAGTSPGLMALSPTRNIAAAFDSSTNSVYAVDTTKESGIGNVRMPGATSSMVVPTTAPLVYAAVPTTTITGFAFVGSIEVMNFSTGAITAIAVSNAQTVVANSTGSQLLVFSNDSDSVTVLSPGVAVPPVDTSCLSNPPNAVCKIVPGFSRPVNAVISGSTAYVLNCGLQCGGSQPASVAIFDLSSFAITNTIPVHAATMAFLNGSTLYVAGTPPSAPDNSCAGSTAAQKCGRLDVVDLGSMTVTATAVITNGYHDRMDMTANSQLFIGAHDCTNIGNVNNPGGGEVRGCLSIFKTADGSVIIPPDNGDVTGLQSFTSRNIEYVAEGGVLRVYDTTKDVLLINTFLPQGTINIVGVVGDVKAIDFF